MELWKRQPGDVYFAVHRARYETLPTRARLEDHGDFDTLELAQRAVLGLETVEARQANSGVALEVPPLEWSLPDDVYDGWTALGLNGVWLIQQRVQDPPLTVSIETAIRRGWIRPPSAPATSEVEELV